MTRQQIARQISDIDANLGDSIYAQTKQSLFNKLFFTLFIDTYFGTSNDSLLNGIRGLTNEPPRQNTSHSINASN